MERPLNGIVVTIDHEVLARLEDDAGRKVITRVLANLVRKPDPG
jgi:hypothetical protein